MKKLVLPNGLTVLYQKKKSKTVVVQALVKAGSNHEPEGERGVAHMMEHLLFEGTFKRPSGKLIANEIEKLGGDFNAYTSFNRTSYYIKVLNKHFSIAMDVLGDVLQNPLFQKKDFERERGVVLKEINMIYDDPRSYQWVLMQGKLYREHPARFPSYGSVADLKEMKVRTVRSFFEKQYVANNMILCIVGNVRDWKKVVKREFGMMRSGPVKALRYKKEKPLRKKQSVVEIRKTFNSHLAMGFRTVTREHKDSYVLDVIQGILGRGQSGRVFAELRGKHGLAYDVGTEHIAEEDHGYFALYASFSKENKAKAERLMRGEIKKLLSVTEDDIKEAKTYLEGEYYLGLEEPQQLADTMLFWEQVGNAHWLEKYLKEIEKVTVADVRRVVRKYLQYPTVAFITGNGSGRKKK